MTTQIVTLTPRERQILDYVGRFIPAKAIGPRMNISYHAVRFHLRGIYKKFGVHELAHAMVVYERIYRDREIIDIDDPRGRFSLASCADVDRAVNAALDAAVA